MAKIWAYIAIDECLQNYKLAKKLQRLDSPVKIEPHFSFIIFQKLTKNSGGKTGRGKPQISKILY